VPRAVASGSLVRGIMAAAVAGGGEEGEELLLLSAVEAGSFGGGGDGGGAGAAAEKSWRLNFDGFRPPEVQQERRPPRGLHHHCLGVLCTISLQLAVARLLPLYRVMFMVLWIYCCVRMLGCLI
jgi:hypothetical protein